MDRKSVKSSTIRSIGYDLQLHILEIEFDSGGIYQYLDAPEHLYSTLMNAVSKGKFFERNIKNNYRYQKIN